MGRWCCWLGGLGFELAELSHVMGKGSSGDTGDHGGQAGAESGGFVRPDFGDLLG